MMTATTAKTRGRPKYKHPGHWRSCEIQRELNQRCGLGYDLSTKQGKTNLRAWFYYLLKVGAIPKGKGRTGSRQLWTDRQVERLFDTLPALIQAGNVGEPHQTQ